MTGHTLLSIGFGIVVISMAFLVLVFWRAYRDPARQHDRRYKVVAGALAIGSLGVGLSAFNPLMQALGGSPLHPAAMFLASALILVAAASLIGSTAMGGDPSTLRWFLACCIGWTVFCVGRAWL